MLVERPAPADGRERGGGGTAPARTVTVNLLESPLGWLHSRGHVSARQYAAGETLRQDWEQAHYPPRVTMCWDAPPPGRTARGSPEPATPAGREVRARARFEAAARAVGPGLRDVMWRVVCAGEGMREAETALGWPARAGKVVLAMALDRLADFYRLP
ncbi:MAG: hypothetical protein JOZ90_13090 [Alphaproteobacteria bacterium]|nr:hypothetical protein [Alphaproteobacteria bacterium]MBV9370335.1 hypothetical protein [Alphaproteobacteria bacterium]MBV9902008.1 hypothetical protein [Alphaproteobacteria bacterium]